MTDLKCRHCEFYTSELHDSIHYNVHLNPNKHQEIKVKTAANKRRYRHLRISVIQKDEIGAEKCIFQNSSCFIISNS